MDSRSNAVGIKMYNPSPQVTQPPPPSQETSVPVDDMPPAAAAAPPPSGCTTGGARRRAIGSGIQKTINKTSMLANFLPTGTLLAFEMVIPSIYGKGVCSPVTNMMTLCLLAMCALSCFFFHFTDGLPGPDGQMNYGFVTRKGLMVFKQGIEDPKQKDPKFTVQITDFVHAFMSALVFIAIAFSDNRVTHCLFRDHAKEVDEVMESFPLMVGLVCSTLFLMFPTTRYGLGLTAS